MVKLTLRGSRLVSSLDSAFIEIAEANTVITAKEIEFRQRWVLSSKAPGFWATVPNRPFKCSQPPTSCKPR